VREEQELVAVVADRAREEGAGNAEAFPDRAPEQDEPRVPAPGQLARSLRESLGHAERVALARLAVELGVQVESLRGRVKRRLGHPKHLGELSADATGASFPPTAALGKSRGGPAGSLTDDHELLPFHFHKM
jgi:hypothetical protein